MVVGADVKRVLSVLRWYEERSAPRAVVRCDVLRKKVAEVHTAVLGLVGLVVAGVCLEGFDVLELTSASTGPNFDVHASASCGGKRMGRWK